MNMPAWPFGENASRFDLARNALITGDGNEPVVQVAAVKHRMLFSPYPIRIPARLLGETRAFSVPIESERRR